MNKVIITALVVAALTTITIRTSLTFDCENLGRFKMNDVVYTCTKEVGDE